MVTTFRACPSAVSVSPGVSHAFVAHSIFVYLMANAFGVERRRGCRTKLINDPSLRSVDEHIFIPLKARARLPAFSTDITKFGPATTGDVIATLGQLDDSTTSGASRPLILPSEFLDGYSCSIFRACFERVGSTFARTANGGLAMIANDLALELVRRAKKGGTSLAGAVNTIIGGCIELLLLRTKKWPESSAEMADDFFNWEILPAASRGEKSFIPYRSFYQFRDATSAVMMATRCEDSGESIE
jgi:hypothetical protein